MSLIKRLAGVFFDPKAVFPRLAERPDWIDALVVVLVALIAFNLVIAPYLQKDNLAMTKDNAALKERLGEDAYAKRLAQMENPSTAMRIVQTFVATPLFFLAGLLLQCLLLLVLGRLFSTQGTYVQVLSVLVHASIIDKLLGNAVRLALALTRGSVMQTSTGLALLFPRLEVTSDLYIILAQVDLFQLWLFGVLAFGLAAVFKVSLRKALILSYGIWFLKALITVLIGLLFMSFYK
jgi:hypothetical protein